MIHFKNNKWEEFSPRVTITSALPYVNGVKHLGNLVGSILPADIFHRFLDLMGVDNIYICGTDDHGTAVEIAAAEEKITPADYARKYKKIQEDIYKQWNFDFTHFGSTSSKTNDEITKALFLAAYKNGYIIHRSLTVPYCEHDKRFLPDRYVTGTCPICGYDTARGDQCEKCSTILDPADLKNPVCTICKQSHITFKQEKHLFLNYTLLSEKLKEWIDGTDWPYNTKTLALGWIKQGLKPRCITRNLTWGINVPLKGFEDKVFYVWFDAPIGYISITKDAFLLGKLKKWKEYWTDAKVYHFLGKDNIPFHTIFWPGTLIAGKDVEVDGKKINFVLPYQVVGYEYLNWEEKKFSTSKGIGLFSDEAIELFPADYWRFYLSHILPDNKDSNFDWDDFQSRINNELIANYGNLFYRVTYFIEKNFSGTVPKGVLDEEGKILYEKLIDTKESVEGLIKDVKLKEALKEIFKLASDTNKYFQDKKPWEQKDAYHAGNTLYTAVNLLRALSILLYPYIPSTADQALIALDTDRGWNIEDQKIKPGHKIHAKILFKKIEDEDIIRAKKYITKYARLTKDEEGKKETLPETINLVNDMIPISEFQKLELVVGTIIDIEDHPKADKLYVLQVDLGKEIRQLVAGLRDKYTKDELKNRQIIIIANLEPKELRGVKSHGMLLAAGDGTIISPIEPVANGAKVM
ncbi:MAG: methionine--tRNA ligase [Candidatus Aenigmarchaeota archaeon]|nr:methionine--tRNA ligase [Candidatus Aenigmarchaeota archaeon]